MGKSRLAPIKSLTIPRMELSAAVLAMRLDKISRDELSIPVDQSFFWMDSTCVLHIRAIHLEIASLLETFALRRFIARRGQPEEIRSEWQQLCQRGERTMRSGQRMESITNTQLSLAAKN